MAFSSARISRGPFHAAAGSKLRILTKLWAASAKRSIQPTRAVGKSLSASPKNRAFLG